MAREILNYNKDRVFAFVLALGEVDDLKYAAAAGAINFGFPVIADTVIPQILPTGITTYEHVISMPWNEISGRDDLEKAERLVQFRQRNAPCHQAKRENHGPVPHPQ